MFIDDSSWRQWRCQGLMVGEAHLVGEANIFNVKYIIHECGLPTICRPPPGGYLLGRYTYTDLQHFFKLLRPAGHY